MPHPSPVSREVPGEGTVRPGNGSSRWVALECLRCGRESPPDTLGRCGNCQGILSARYSMKGYQWGTMGTRSLWEFQEVLPPVPDAFRTSLGEGSTPYVPLAHLGREVGLPHLLAKLEGTNPTGSFKDRAAALGVSLARTRGARGVFTASSGNAASAIAAYCARAGLPCVVMAREDITASKRMQIGMYGARIVPVRHLFDTEDTLTQALRAAGRAAPDFANLFVWAPWNPLLVDAMKTIAYEMALQGPLPDAVLVPVAGGDLLYGIHKGFSELREAGLIPATPRMIAVQGEGASPLVTSFLAGHEEVLRGTRADTVAGALRVTFGGEHALQALRESGGTAVAVPDAAILAAQRRIAAREGIFCEVSSATTVAALESLRTSGQLGPGDTVAVILTGLGFKDHPADMVGSAPEASREISEIDAGLFHGTHGEPRSRPAP